MHLSGHHPSAALPVSVCLPLPSYLVILPSCTSIPSSSSVAACHMSTMAMAPCDGDADWCHVLGDFNFNLLLCSSSSSQHAMASSRSVYWSASVSRARASDLILTVQQARFASPDGSRSTFISSLLPDVRAGDCLPIAAAAPPGPGGHLHRCKTEVLEAPSDDDQHYAHSFFFSCIARSKNHA